VSVMTNEMVPSEYALVRVDSIVILRLYNASRSISTSSYRFEKARTRVSLMQMYIQRILCLILIPDPSTSYVTQPKSELV